MNQAHKVYVVSYPFEGERWHLEICATSLEEAQARLKALPWGSVDGELVATIPLTWFDRLRLWWTRMEAER